MDAVARCMQLEAENAELRQKITDMNKDGEFRRCTNQCSCKTKCCNRKKVREGKKILEEYYRGELT